ncbi:DUF4244 domain-containing protein [Arthrobacter roseus]|uniref:DUF4244 domain-containing protein n=1 Tax=Arthrobacter roseus TaxID=136274 RepID=UPI001EF956ED|nr:DUF4244 domain-containing protein [Arthrobacter roseus]MBM7849541.1 hypothetical protein [Arthrobacter roseus]
MTATNSSHQFQTMQVPLPSCTKDQPGMATVTAIHPQRTNTEKVDIQHREAGMATAEYAIATLAAVGFAALLVAVLASGEVRGMLMGLIQTALTFG